MKIWTAAASTLVRQPARSLVSRAARLGEVSVVSRSAEIFSVAASSADFASRSLSSGYMADKKAAKERRRALYESRQQRKERLKTRRLGKRRDEKRREFRSWFIEKKVDEEYMNRKARQAGLDWKIQVAVILERYSVVLPDKEDWEVEYENLKAHLMQFDKQYPKELINIDYDREVAVTDEELLALLPKGYTPAPRETEADKTGDVRTTERKLKTSIYLTVQDEGPWQFPTVPLKEDETLLEAAKRAIPEKAGSELEYWTISNCPCAVHMAAFPENERTSGFYGTKTFFMKLCYDEGAASPVNIKDYAWLAREEMAERVKEEQGDKMSRFYHYLL